MFLTIFKTITSVLLVAMFAVVISHRELVIQQKTKFFPGSKKTTPAAELPISEKNQTSRALELSDGTTTPKVPTLTPSRVIDSTPPFVIVSHSGPQVIVRQSPTDPQYVKMKEGASDTDELYLPTISPCKVTMKYKIGRFDTNFGISQSKFIDEINQASNLWGNELGKKLFAYDENGTLTINLIYDERQVQTNNMNILALEIQNSKDAAESLKSLYEQEKEIYLGDGEQLTKDSNTLIARYKIYTDKVTTYNNKGGAPQAEYEAMTQELTYLKTTSTELETRRISLLLYMEKINAKVNHYNELVVYINNLIKESNAAGAKKFTEGRFNPNTNTIDIYQYNDTIKLRRVITHELGHVLGINHNNNVYSIMYSVNSATTTILSEDDISSLMKVCSR